MNGLPTLPEAEGWSTLAKDWQSGPPRATIDVAALRDRLETERRRMVSAVVGEIVVTLGYLVGPAYQLIQHPGPDSTFLAINAWIAIAAAWGFSLWSGRGTWKPLANTTEMFLVLERQRLLARLRGARAALLFVVVQCASVFLWIRLRPSGVSPGGPNRVLLLLPAAVVIVVIVLAIRVHRQVPRMVAGVDRLLAELRRPDDSV